VGERREGEWKETGGVKGAAEDRLRELHIGAVVVKVELDGAAGRCLLGLVVGKKTDELVE